MTLLFIIGIWLAAVVGIILFFNSATRNDYTHPIEEMYFDELNLN